MNIKDAKFKKLGLYAIAATVSAASLFQLGNFVSDQVYNINQEEYTQNDTVKFGSVENFKVESLIRAIDKNVAQEEKWDALPKSALAEIKKVKQLIKSDEFKNYLKNDEFYRVARHEAKFGMHFDLSKYKYDTFVQNVANESLSKPSLKADLIANNTLESTSIFNKYVDLISLKEVSADKFVTDIDDMSVVRSKIDKIRTENTKTSFIDQKKLGQNKI